MNQHINPENLYSLDIPNYNTITDNNNDNEIINYFWAPNKLLIEKLELLLNKSNINDKIIDVGCGEGNAIFPKATHILGLSLKINPNNLQFINFDLDFDKFIQNDKYFNFIYCRHTLEDIQNPQNAFAELTRVSKQGYIETPSPLVELTKGSGLSEIRGYPHHRYIVWSDLKTNTLHFLPKYPIVELLEFDKNMTQKLIHILNNYSVYWNNYYIWDESNPPKIIVYRNEVNFNILTDYDILVAEAINKSIDYTNHFIQKIKNL